MPKRRNQKKVQADSDGEAPQTGAKLTEGSESIEPGADTTGSNSLDQAEAGSSSVPMPQEEEKKEPTPPVHVLYCEICSLPAEYCEFGSSATKCMKWLEGAHPDVWGKYYSEEALVAKASALTLEQQTKLAASTAKKESKADAKAKIEEEKKKDRKVIIKRVERTKRKYVTVIQGLEAFSIDLKQASKLFAQKFATGASVSKSAPGSGFSEEVVIQGDVAYDVEEMFEEASTGGGGKSAELFKEIGDSAEIVEGKK